MRYVFAECVLDVGQRQLRRGGEPVSLQPQVFDLLIYLIRNRDRVVGKDDLLDEVWRGRIVSDSTLASRISAARTAVGDTGAAQRLIRTLSRKGLRFVGDVIEEGDIATVPANGANGVAYALPDRPSIAVLPFTNLSEDAAQDYFADGIVEEIITELSRDKSLLVIARNSTFVFKGKAVDIKVVGRELGARYVLEGSVRKSNGRVRVAGQLIDTETGAHLWADRFEGALADVFDLEDRVTASVVGAVTPKIQDAEIRRALRKPIASLDAYDQVLRARAAFNAFQVVDALALCREAVAIDPTYALAYAMAAQCVGWRKALGIGGAVGPEEEREARDFARRAVDCGGDDPTVLWMAGQALVLLSHDYDRALDLIERALAIAPNSAPALNASGWTRWSVGDGEISIAQFLRAMRISPLDPSAFLFRSGIGWAHFVEGRYADAVEWSDKALSLQPHCFTSLRCKVAACGLLGRADQARQAVEALLAIQPDDTISSLQDVIPLKRAEHMDAFLRGLRQAGMPE